MSKILNFLNKNKVDFFIITACLVLYIGIRLINFLNVPPAHLYDEGNYLYAGKLIAHGYMPDKDFSVGHMPIYLYLISFLWRLGLDFNGIHVVHLVLTSLIIIPLYLIAKYFFARRSFAILACLFIIFSPRLFYYSRIVILDPIAMLFIAWAIYFYFCREGKYKNLISGIMLGLAVSIKISFLLSFPCLVVADFFYAENKGLFLKLKLKQLLIGFFLIIGPLFIWLLAVSNFLNDTIVFHLITRERMGWLERVFRLLSIYDFIFFLGLVASFFAIFALKNNNKIRILATWALMGVLLSFSAFKTFFAQHIVQFIPALIIVLLWFLFSIYKKFGLIILFSIICLIIVPLSFNFFVIEFNRTLIPESKVINVLKPGKGYLYTATPYFALKSNREITPWYYMNLSAAAFEIKVPSKILNEIMTKSSTILLDRRAEVQLPKDTLAFIYDNFRIIYQEADYTVLEK